MISIRPLREDERPAWEPLWQGYLAFYRASVAPDVTASTWSRLHDPGEPMHVLGAFLPAPNGGAGERLVGIVHYIFHRSTWTIGPYCYLQDLFTAPEARGQGAGRALIEAVYERARAAGASRVYWLTQEDNATARALYDKLADLPGFIQYRKLSDPGRLTEPVTRVPDNPHAEVAAGGGPRSTHDRSASFEAPLRAAPQDEEGGVSG